MLPTTSENRISQMYRNVCAWDHLTSNKERVISHNIRIPAFRFFRRMPCVIRRITLSEQQDRSDEREDDQCHDHEIERPDLFPLRRSNNPAQEDHDSQLWNCNSHDAPWPIDEDPFDDFQNLLQRYGHFMFSKSKRTRVCQETKMDEYDQLHDRYVRNWLFNLRLPSLSEGREYH